MATYTLTSAQMADGEFYDKGKFNYSMSETRRRIISFSIPSNGRVIFNLVSSNWNSNPFLITTSTQTDKVKITGLSPFNGTWSVLGTGTNSITVSIPNILTNTTANVTFNAMATRVTATGADRVENRNLKKIRFQLSLKATSNMCAMQNQVFTFLSDFYKDPEVKREYSAKYNLYKNSWETCGYGFPGDYSLTSTTSFNSFLKCWMCLVFAESSWRATAILGPEYITINQTINNYKNWYSESKPVGLWAVSNKAGSSYWPTSYTETDHNGVALPFNREYNTRIAAWIMFNRLFNSSSDYVNEFCKPFRSWSTPVSSNSNYTNCQNNMPPYPKSLPNCEDFSGDSNILD